MTEHSRSGVFVSYRRQDTQHAAGRLCDRLRQALGRSAVFMDVDGIKPGVDFVQRIEDTVTASAVMVVLVGPDWNPPGDDGRRLDDPHDFVRLEVQTALASGLPVIPVLVEGAKLPGREELPDALEPLLRRNATTLAHATFDTDAARIVEAVQRAGASADPMRWVERWGTYAIQLVLVGVFGVNGYWRVSLTIEELVANGQGYLGRQTPELLVFVGISQLLAATFLVLPPLTRITRLLAGLSAAGLCLQMTLASIDHIVHGELTVLSASSLMALLSGIVVWARLVRR